MLHGVFNDSNSVSNSFDCSKENVSIDTLAIILLRYYQDYL